MFHVDVSYSREKASQISAAILTAVNTCGGFKLLAGVKICASAAVARRMRMVS